MILHLHCCFWTSGSISLWPVPVTDLMTDQNRNAHEVVPDKLESDSWRSMSSSLWCVDAVWDMASDRDVWRAQRPVAGQEVQ